jgi:hypothetical protein
MKTFTVDAPGTKYSVRAERYVVENGHLNFMCENKSKERVYVYDLVCSFPPGVWLRVEDDDARVAELSRNGKRML